MMKAEDIREWDNVEVRARLGELREERFRLRFQMGTMQLENPKMLQHIRRDVARLNTILRERELSEKSTEAAVPHETAETTTDAEMPPTETAVPATEAALPPETEE
jgi:large subunit ribosomal protein L29